MDVEAFYRRLEDMQTLPTSSQPSVDSLLDGFTKRVSRGHDVLGIFISEEMSGTVQTARIAGDMARGDSPEPGGDDG